MFWGQCVRLENLFKSIQTQPQSDTSRVLRSFRPTFVATSVSAIFLGPLNSSSLWLVSTWHLGLSFSAHLCSQLLCLLALALVFGLLGYLVSGILGLGLGLGLALKTSNDTPTYTFHLLGHIIGLGWEEGKWAWVEGEGGWGVLVILRFHVVHLSPLYISMYSLSQCNNIFF